MSDTGILLRVSDVAAWERQAASIDARIAELMAEQAQIRKRIEAATALISLLGAGEERPEAATKVPSGGSHEPTEESPWNAVIRETVYSYPLGARSHQVRQAVAESELGEKLAESDKAYYHAIRRLVKKNVILKHNGRLFSPDAYQRYTAKAARGEIDDTAPLLSPQASPLAPAVMLLVEGRPGINSGDVIAHLRADPKLREYVSGNGTAVYNLIARMCRRKQLTKRERGLYPGVGSTSIDKADDGGGLNGHLTSGSPSLFPGAA